MASSDLLPTVVPSTLLATDEIFKQYELFDNRASPRTEAMVAAAVQWADRIIWKIDSVFGGQ